MGNSEETLEKIGSIHRKDPRYRPEAYVFTFESLNFTLEQKSRQGHQGHINGRQLLYGIRHYARDLFGYLARAVFEEWGVYSTSDFGEIVFNLVDAGLLSKQETDTKDDFANVFDFAEAFEGAFIDPRT